MNKLGIYFGSRVINLAEISGRQILNNIQINLPSANSDASAIVLPEEDKIVALVSEELKKKNIGTREAAVSLSGKDLIIRNFEMAILPRDEIAGAVNFEVRKYIPFKTEELVADFQYKTDKAAQKNRILFVAIKKETIERYASIINKLGLKMISLEYSAFSILRLLKLGGVPSQRGVRGIFNVDLAENDEVNFLVLEDGFPLFSRDVMLLGAAAVSETAKPEIPEPNVVLEKLKREIRISMDYYDRTLPLKNIDKIFFMMDRNYQAELEGFISFIRDIGLSSQFVDLKRCLGKNVPFSLAFLKSYATALTNVNIGLKPNLLQAREKSEKKVVVLEQPKTKAGALLMQLRSQTAKALAIAIFICLGTYYFGASRLFPLGMEISKIKKARPAVTSGIKPNASYDELVRLNADYRKKIDVLDGLLTKRTYLTELLDAIPRLIPGQMRLSELSFKKEAGGEVVLMLRGMVYMGDSNQEMDTVNRFLAVLKSNAVFSKYFGDLIGVVSINHQEMFGKSVTTFVISCRK
ncbi:MAG: pilus assembly protein PilM [Candidatus Omnitrophota bacterium]